MAVPVVGRVSELVGRPSAGAAISVIQVTAIWALLAGLAWVARLVAMTSCGRWGARTRQRVRQSGQGRRLER